MEQKQEQKVIVTKLKCLHCGYEWLPRTTHPEWCPKCGRHKFESVPVEVKK